MPEDMKNTVEEVVAAAPAKRRGRPKKSETVAKEATVEKKAATKTTAKKTTTTKRTKKTVRTESILLQYLGKEIDTAEIMKLVTEHYVAEGHSEAEITDVKVYVKPEEDMAYYVINDSISGKISF